MMPDNYTSLRDILHYLYRQEFDAACWAAVIYNNMTLEGIDAICIYQDFKATQLMVHCFHNNRERKLPHEAAYERGIEIAKLCGYRSSCRISKRDVHRYVAAIFRDNVISMHMDWHTAMLFVLNPFVANQLCQPVETTETTKSATSALFS